MSFDSLLGEGSAGRQLLVYGVGYEVARALLGPMFTEIEYQINNNSPIIELSPAELAELVVRGVIANEPDAAARAQKYGLSADKFDQMVRLAGEPPGLVQVLEWWRRGYLPWDQGIGAPSVAEAIRTSRIYSYWTDTIQKAQFQPPSPADAINAVLRNQVTLEEGISMAYFAGLGVTALAVPAGSDTAQTATAFQVLLDTAGRPPAPGELGVAANRGVIPWGNLDPATKVPNAGEISFAQGIYEGDTKDKWLPIYADLARYEPPPRTVVALLRSGAISVADATTYLEHAGVSPALAAQYVVEATTAKTTKQKELSEQRVVTLFTDKLIDLPTATADLELLGYNAAEAEQILTSAVAENTLSDFRGAISRIRGYYIAHRVTDVQASDALAALGVTADKVATYLAQWRIDQEANIKVLSETQIVTAWFYNNFSSVPATNEAIAMGKLQQIGYSAYDAWVLLSNRNKGPLGSPPPDVPQTIQ